MMAKKLAEMNYLDGKKLMNLIKEKKIKRITVMQVPSALLTASVFDNTISNPDI